MENPGLVPERIGLLNDIQHPIHVPSRGFLVTLRNCMGRLWSTCASFSYHLYKLISKTKRAAEPALNKANPDKVEKTSPKKKIDLSPSSSKLSRILSPVLPKSERMS